MTAPITAEHIEEAKGHLEAWLITKQFYDGLVERLAEQERLREEQEMKYMKRKNASDKIREFLLELEKWSYDNSDIAKAIFRQIWSERYILQDLQKEEETDIIEEIEANEE